MRPLHGDKSRFDPVESVVHNSETSGCNYCCSSFLEGCSQNSCFFSKKNLFLSPSPLFDFYGSLRAKYGAWWQILRCIFWHTGLLFKLASQSREGDNDLLSVLPQNNKITSLPRCSGQQNAIKSTDSWVNVFLYSLQISCKPCFS